MLVTRTHPFTGVVHVQEIPVTQEQLDRWYSGTVIQNAMPNLTPDQREFLMTGLLPEDFEALKG
jgi:hypothetical protein